MIRKGRREPTRKGKGLRYLERLRRRRLGAQADRLLAQVLLRLLDEEEFVAYLHRTWTVRPELDPASGRLEVTVHRNEVPEPEGGAHGCAQP